MGEVGLLTAMEMRFGVSVSWAAVLMMQPLSFSPFPGRQDEQTVGEREERVLLDRRVGGVHRGAGFSMELRNRLRHGVDVRELGFG